jgi:hypothetical protein
MEKKQNLGFLAVSPHPQERLKKSRNQNHWLRRLTRSASQYSPARSSMSCRVSRSSAPLISDSRSIRSNLGTSRDCLQRLLNNGAFVTPSHPPLLIQ